MPRGGFHNHPTREVACKACGQTFTTSKPGRQAWYCHQPECDEAREQARRAQWREDKQRNRKWKLRRAWIAHAVERAEKKTRLTGLPPRQVLALATRQLAMAQTADEHREAARAVAGAALALAFWIDNEGQERIAA